MLTRPSGPAFAYTPFLSLFLTGATLCTAPGALMRAPGMVIDRAPVWAHVLRPNGPWRAPHARPHRRSANGAPRCTFPSLTPFLSLSLPLSLSLSLLFPLSRPRPRWRRKKSWTPTPLLPPPPQPTNITSVVLNAALMLLGSGGSLLLHLYFVHDGHHLWLPTFLQDSAWPILLLPLSISHLFLPTAGPIATRRYCSLFLLLPWPLGAASAVLGLLIALDSYLYAYGSSYFPLSTSSLLMASQMAFTAIFAFLIVHQDFTPFSLNSVVLLMLGPIVLSLSGGGNRLIPTFPFSP